MTAAIAVVQAGTVLGRTDLTLEKLRLHASEAARQGVKLIVFPEAFIGGYPKGLTFGASLGIRTPEGRELFKEYADGAIEVPGPVIDAVAEIAREHSLFMVIGVVERAGGTLYCTVVFIGADGTLLGKHRKLMPTAIERLIWGFGDGSTLSVLDSPAGKVGALICWENYMPLAHVALYQQNVQLYCAPTVDDREVWIPTVRHIAREGRCFVLSSCQFLTRDAYPPGWLATTKDLPDTPIRGGSCVVGPMGDLLAGPLYGEEGVVVADIDLAQLPSAKFDFDVVGHYARPDVFQLTLRTPVGKG